MNKKLAIISLMSIILVNSTHGYQTNSAPSHGGNSTIKGSENGINAHSNARYDELSRLIVDTDAENVVLPPSKAAHDWTNFSSFSADDNNFITSVTFKHTKTHKLSKKASIAAQPIIIDNHIFILNTSGIISSYDIYSWKKVWSKKLESHGPFTNKSFSKGSVVYNDGKLYIAYGSRYVIVLNAEDGTEVFRKQFVDIVKSAPLIHDNKMIVLTINNQLYCMNLEDRSFAWIPYQAIQPRLCNNWAITAPLIYNNQQVVAAFSPEEIVSLDIQNGTRLWSYDLNREYLFSLEKVHLSTITSQPIIHNDTLYAASDTVLAAYNLAPQQLKWRKHIDSIDNMNLIGNTIFVSTHDSRLIAINADSGKIVWITRLWPIDKVVKKANESSFKYSMRKLGHFFRTVFKSKAVSYVLPPVLANDNLLIINNNKLFLVNPYDGNIIAKQSIKANPQYFAISDGKLYIFRDHAVDIKQ